MTFKPQNTEGVIKNMTIELLSQRDWVLVPFYGAILFFFTKFWANKYYVGQSIRKYIFPAWAIRCLGCFISVWYHQFYYKGGDAFIYFDAALRLNGIFWQDPLEALSIIFSPADCFSPENWVHLKLTTHSLHFLYEANALMCKIGGILSLVTFKSYLCISLITCYMSFLGSWKLFLVFQELYPHLEKKVAVSMLFIPSVCFWGGGGLQKETILVASLGYFINCFYRILNKKIDFKTVFIGLLSFGIIAIVRTYIAIVLIPAIFLWAFLQYKKNIQKMIHKVGLAFIIFILSGIIINMVTLGFCLSKRKY
jgi:hypothetical protein